MGTDPPRSSVALREGLALALGYALLAALAIGMARQPGSVATVWFANALGIGVIASAASHRLGLLAAVVAGNLAANLACGDGLALSLQFALANTAEVALGVWLLRRYGRIERFALSPRGYALVVGCGAFLPQLLGATLGAAVLQWQGFGRFERVLPDWYIGSALGAVLVLPPVLLWRQLGWRAGLARLASLPLASIALLTVGLTLIALGQLPHPFAYLILPMTLAAFMLPLFGALVNCLLFGFTVTLMLALGLFIPPPFSHHWQHLLVYVPVLLCAISLQLLAVLVEQQRRSRQTLSALTSATGDLLVYFDRDGIVQNVNRAWEDAWQRRAADVTGRHVIDTLNPTQRPAGMPQRIAGALAGRTEQALIEVDLPLRGRRRMNVAYQPALDADGSRIGVIFTAHDVTELMNTQLELERRVTALRSANESLEQFARITSHDLREPLNTIVQFTGLIEQDHRDTLAPAARQYFDLVRGGATRMRTMLDDLLQFVRLDNVGRPELLPVALDETLRDACGALTARIGARQAVVEIDPLPTVAGHASLLALLFQNLLGNAIKFVPAERRPQVRVSARRDGAWVVVTVADNGIGIAEGDIGKLFVPFKRLHARRKFDGTGLGLATCKRIVDALGGSIEIESAPGEGSRFLVRLRAAD